MTTESLQIPRGKHKVSNPWAVGIRRATIRCRNVNLCQCHVALEIQARFRQSTRTSCRQGQQACVTAQLRAIAFRFNDPFTLSIADTTPQIDIIARPCQVRVNTGYLMSVVPATSQCVIDIALLQDTKPPTSKSLRTRWSAPSWILNTSPFQSPSPTLPLILV